MSVMLQGIELLPVNLLQVVFASVAALGAMLIWHLKRFRALAVYFLFNTVLMLFNLLEELDFTSSWYLLTPAFTLVTGPLIYFFIRGAVNDQAFAYGIVFFHFIPMLLALPFTEHVQAVIVAGTMSQLTYLAASFHLLYRYHNASMATRSDAVSMALNWLTGVLFVYACVIVNDVIRLNLQTTVSAQLKATWYFATVAIIFAIVCYLLFKVLRQPQLFNGLCDYEQSIAAASRSNDEAMASAVFSSIEETINSGELYKQPRLSVTDVSEATGLSVKDISWAINQACQQNFCEFVNGLRVKAVQEQIQAGAGGRTPLLSIALNAGFNSKSTFNAVFKKVVGLTPSQYARTNGQA